MTARPITVTLQPSMSFQDAVVLIQSLWALTKKGVPFRETKRKLEAQAPVIASYRRWQTEQDEPIRQEYLDEIAEWEALEDHTRMVLTSAMPLAHYVNFAVVVENHSRAFLDQFVRELVTGIDVWTGSSRINPADTFVEDGTYQNGASVNADPELLDVRARSLEIIQQAYLAEVAAGATIEQAREILPLAISLPVTCTASIRRLSWIISKRTSFILQKSLWGPVIAQIMEQLAEWDPKIAAKFRVPPCVLRNMCPYAIDLKGRWTPKLLDGTDTTPEQWIAQVTEDTVRGLDQRRDYHDPNAVCPVYVDRWAGADREALLAFARLKHPGWNQIAADYLAYAGLEPEWLTGLPEPTGKSAH